MYVTQEYDFYTALLKELGPDLVISNVRMLTPSQYLIETPKGKYMCESFADRNETIWTKVWSVR